MHEPPRTLVGRYQLGRVVGRGGMGTVYLAEDLVLGRTVAVKLLAAALLDDPIHVARFEREARAAASLAHPGIVAVYDTGVDAGAHFIVMELVTGRSLAELIGDQRGGRAGLGAERAVGIARGVADALAAAHAAGLVHRDVKPANVMVADDPGRVKVLDFGIARALDGTGTALTQTASILGTAAYMAPEQALGHPADARSDIYSLGCLLYALVAGRPPFAGDTAPAITHQHVHVDPVPLRRSDERLPAGLDALVLQMLNKTPEDRPQTAVDVRDRLDRIFAGLVGGAGDTTELLGDPGTTTDRLGGTTERLGGTQEPVEARGGPVVPRVPRVPVAPAALAHGDRRRAAGSGRVPAHAGAGRDAAGVGPAGGPRQASAAGRRRRWVIAALCGVLALVVLLVILVPRQSGGGGVPAAGGSGPGARGASSTSTPRQTAAPSSRTTPQASTPATTPAGRRPPTTTATSPGPSVSGPVAGAAAGLATLVAQAARVGAISSAAASRLTSGLAAIVSSVNAGNPTDAQRKLTEFGQTAQTLEGQGQIGGLVAAGLNAALGALGAAIAASTAAAQTGASRVLGRSGGSGD